MKVFSTEMLKVFFYEKRKKRIRKDIFKKKYEEFKTKAILTDHLRHRPHI